MEIINIPIEDFKELLRNAFIQGEEYQKQWELEQIGEIEENTEKDFKEWFKTLNLNEYEKSTTS